VIVEREQRFLATQKQCNHIIDLIDCKGFPANMNTVINERMRLVVINCFHNRHCLLKAAQARLPRNRNSMECGSNSIHGQLPVGIEHGDIKGEQGIGARHHLALKGITMDVHDSWQNQATASFCNLVRARRQACADFRDFAVTAANIHLNETFFRNKALSAPDQKAASLVMFRLHDYLLSP
jgi:hypothetical protein